MLDKNDPSKASDQLDRILANEICDAMRIETRMVMPTAWLREFFSDQIIRANTSGKFLVDRHGNVKAFGPKTLFQFIFGSWRAIPMSIREVLEADKQLKDPLGRAHNRLAWLISDIQRTTPRALANSEAATWQSQLKAALATNQKATLAELFRLLASQEL